MKPVDNWRVIIRRAWSWRLILLAAILGAIAAALQIAPSLFSLPIWVQLALALLAPVVSIAALVARVLVQKDLTDGNS